MKLKRRGFLKVGLFSSIAAGVPVQGIAKEPMNLTPRFRDDRLSILQGATDETATQFSIVHRRDLDLEFVVETEVGMRLFPDSVDYVTKGDHPFALSKAYFSGLVLGFGYQLVTLDSDGNEVDRRSFKTLSGDIEEPRFAIASCMDEARHEPGIWQDMIQNTPDFILFVGDSVYADRRPTEERFIGPASPEQLWARFVEARRTLEIYHNDQLIPIFATWDDHDFGQNDTGKDYPFIEESTKNFLNFFPQDPDYCRFLEAGPGVSSALTIGKQLFLLMDDRSFREDGRSRKRYAHWGRQQEEWALSQIDSQPNDSFVWWINGTQVFPTMLFKESVRGDHYNALVGLCDELKKRPQAIGFISGDVHFSELSAIESDWVGHGTVEITSSSIHSYTLPGLSSLIPNRRRIVSTGQRNYILVEAKIIDGQAEMLVTSHSKDQVINFGRGFVIGR